MLVRFFLFLPNTSVRVGYALGVLTEGSAGEDSVGGKRGGSEGKGVAAIRLNGLEVQRLSRAGGLCSFLGRPLPQPGELDGQKPCLSFCAGQRSSRVGSHAQGHLDVAGMCGLSGCRQSSCEEVSRVCVS